MRHSQLPLCLHVGRPNTVKWVFKEKIALVVCLSHGTGFPSQSWVLSPSLPLQICALLVAAAWALDVFVIKQDLASGGWAFG